MTFRRERGNEGEDLASAYIHSLGYKILKRQYSNRFGEIDLIAEDGNEVVFIEVKMRQSHEYGRPEESVTRTKLQKMWRAMQIYLQEQKREEDEYRIDVIAITKSSDEPDIHHIKDIDMTGIIW